MSDKQRLVTPQWAWDRWERDRRRLLRRAESQQARFNRHIECNWPYVRWPEDEATRKDERR